MTQGKIKAYLKKVVPGLITGGADNDPAGITTYSVSASLFGYGQLWLMVLATPMLVAVQATCARLANVRRQGLSTILQEQFSPLVAWAAASILVVSNVVTIGADILAVSLALELLTKIDLKFWVLPITILIWYVVLFENYKVIRRFLLWLVLFFLAYIAAAVLAHPQWLEVAKNLIWPSLHGFSKAYYTAAVAILGTTITPYLFFWQVKEELEERRSISERLDEARHEDRINAPGFIFSQIITVFIMVATGATLFKTGGSIASATDAAKALAPLAGHWATYLFAIGIIGSGLLALPVLTVSTAEVVAETARFKHHNLNNKVKSAKGFYAVITLSLLAGVGILILGINPLKALYYSQVLAGLLAPFLLILIILLANKKELMGEYRSGWFDNFFGTLALVVMCLAAVLMFVS